MVGFMPLISGVTATQRSMVATKIANLKDGGESQNIQ
jgi:hypothetical protein